MRVIPFLFAFCTYCYTGISQETVFITAADNSKVKADLYMQNNRLPFILLFHERENSDEYSRLSSRFLNLNYNCLSVTVRNSGTRVACMDIEAAIAFSKKIIDSPVILLGSTRCASLCLLSARGNNDVRAVIALSPGEYFQPAIKISDEIKNIEQQVFVAATPGEFPYVKQMFTAGRENITLFRPEKNTGFHGSAVLGDLNPSYSEYWFALMMFFKKLDRQQKN